jgi:hypothetical protein
MKKIILIIAVILVVVFIVSQKSEDISNEEAITNGGVDQNTEESEVKENAGYETISISSVRGISRVFAFNVAVPEDWVIRVINGGDEVNFYNPGVEGENTIEKSQIFLYEFVANDFQAPDNISVLSRKDEEFAEQPAVTYVLSPQEGASFPGQPSWRKEIHKITNIRLQEENPSRFYAFAKSPDLPEAEFQRFLNSIEL